ncbi:DUF1566 domain-containing protein [Desulfococcaceae bacterium HSG8]|nr:DUF1566 domain-containing protein [Desulfococcaceae bacterium HSG8]
MWQQSDSRMNFEEAQAYIDDLSSRRFAGYNDWRLPTLEELESLLENKNVYSLYIHPVFDGKRCWYWSSDREITYDKYGNIVDDDDDDVEPRVASARWAWHAHVGFNVGLVRWNEPDDPYDFMYVRAVRSGQ